jgi:hypothetical protein
VNCKLADGRLVSLSALVLRDTYYTALEGDEVGLSDLYRRRGLAQWVAKLGSFTGCPNVQVLDPGTDALPRAFCVGFFKMFGQGQPKTVCCSQLLVGWFANGLDFESRALVEGAVKAVDWDRHAETILVADL